MQYSIEILLSWVKAGEIAIPETQRPFVWEPARVRDLLDSLYRGYPIGYLITWRTPNLRLKDGTLSTGKRILIDGQQRITALMTALLGREVLNEDYESKRIRIAFNPQEERFEVANPAIDKILPGSGIFPSFLRRWSLLSRGLVLTRCSKTTMSETLMLPRMP